MLRATLKMGRDTSLNLPSGDDAKESLNYK